MKINKTSEYLTMNDNFKPRLILVLFLFGSFITLHATPLDKDSALIGGDSDRRDEIVEPISQSGSSNNNNSISVGTLSLPNGYNKLIIPLANVTDAIFVMIKLEIREVLNVDTKEETVELDTEIGVSWIDWEIWKHFLNDKELRDRAKYGPEEITLDSEFLRNIWKPDIYIDEMASVERTSLLSKLITLKFLVRNDAIPGAITFKSRQSLTLRCDMDFHFYPADTQKCEYNIRSYSYPVDKLFLIWDELRSVYLDNIEDSNFDFQISSVEPGGEYEDLILTSQTKLSQTNFSSLSFTIEIRRNVTYHLVQTYLPAVLLMLITWLCFLLPADMVEARIGISMTTLLTLTAMFTAVREQAPEVSYAMAIDIWMVFCIFCVFLALVLFTVVYWMRRKLEAFQTKKKDKQQQNMNGEVANGQPDKVDDDEETYIKIVENARRYAFWLFAVIFFLFITTYSYWLFLYSGYYDWNPSHEWNAIPLDDPENNTNRLFFMQKKKFEENDTFKITTSEFRYDDIVEQVIEPKIAANDS